jgi:hypothetical protein
MDDILSGWDAIASYIGCSKDAAKALEGWPIWFIGNSPRACKAALDERMGRRGDLERRIEQMIGILKGQKAQIDGLIQEFEQMREG